MSKLFFTFILIAFLSCKKEGEEKRKTKSVFENYKEITENKDFPTKIAFDKRVHDFGIIEEGEVVEAVFKVSNVGRNDLILTDAFGSCGCTIPEVSNKPIKPGKSYNMKVKFDSKGKKGNVNKTITIICNTKDNFERLEIKANIKTK